VDGAESGRVEGRDAGPSRACPARVGDGAAPGLDLQSAASAPRQGGSDRPSGLQKDLPAVVHTLRQAYPQQEVARWATDPHRIGLKPILRRVWSPRGQRPGAVGPHRYQWCDLYAFVPPQTGRTWWLWLPTVSLAALMIALVEFAQAAGAGQGTQILLVLESAGWPVSPQVQAPAGIHRHVRPPYSPALQPAERLWPLTNEALAHRHVGDVDDLQTVQAARCLQWQARPEMIAAHTRFHWWPQTV
jgi:transposase